MTFYRGPGDYDPGSAGRRAFLSMIDEMRDMFLKRVGKTLPDYLDLSLRERFTAILHDILNEINQNKMEAQKLIEDMRKMSEKQNILSELIEDGLLTEQSIASPTREIPLRPDIDDVSPNMFKNACYAQAQSVLKDVTVDVALTEFLRGVVDRVGETMGWKRRMNIGPNRHFPRMAMWLKELEADTEWDDGIGFWLLNTSGTGRVREYPVDPRTLKIRLDPKYI